MKTVVLGGGLVFLGVLMLSLWWFFRPTLPLPSEGETMEGQLTP
ncbi:MAG: hypothetical protein N2045_12720 [Fimbriimonadales bacterium]|nr:hypothetical protein [Fimbriimonadales bacterium]